MVMMNYRMGALQTCQSLFCQNVLSQSSKFKIYNSKIVTEADTFLVNALLE